MVCMLLTLTLTVIFCHNSVGLSCEKQRQENVLQTIIKCISVDANTTAQGKSQSSYRLFFMAAQNVEFWLLSSLKL
jgi:hypothetical protein